MPRTNPQWRVEYQKHGHGGQIPLFTHSNAPTEQDAAEEYLRRLAGMGAISKNPNKGHRFHVSARRNRGWSKTFLIAIDVDGKVRAKLVDQTPKRIGVSAPIPVATTTQDTFARAS